MLRTRSPLIRGPKPRSPFDLHVLGAPPAFVLSQDQTLRRDRSSGPEGPASLSVWRSAARRGTFERPPDPPQGTGRFMCTVAMSRAWNHAPFVTRSLASHAVQFSRCERTRLTHRSRDGQRGGAAPTYGSSLPRPVNRSLIAGQSTTPASRANRLRPTCHTPAESPGGSPTIRRSSARHGLAFEADAALAEQTPGFRSAARQPHRLEEGRYVDDPDALLVPAEETHRHHDIGGSLRGLPRCLKTRSNDASAAAPAPSPW